MTNNQRRSARRWCAGAVAVALVGAGAVVAPAVAASAATPSTAYSDGDFHVDIPNVVRSSNIILGQPNGATSEAMPLGNGNAGAAVWAANGFTAQINRNDTFPDRKSPGQVTIPGLAAMTASADYRGELDLYTGTYIQQGGGMTVKTYLRADKDELVVDVSGAAPGSDQTATAYLWDGRTPTAATSADGTIATLAETWIDNANGGDGSTWGSLLGLTSESDDVSATVVDSKTVKIEFTADAEGDYTVIVASPSWKGGNGPATVQQFLGDDVDAAPAALADEHEEWWEDYWSRVNPMQLSSEDGTAQYMENLRTLFQYQQASLMRGEYPGSQAGSAPLFSSIKDVHTWVPAAYWFWNIRMQIAANLGGGAPELNDTIFNLYTSNVENIEAWTREHVPGTEGGCVSETMRYNGGGDYGGWTANRSCDTTIAPSYNSQTFSTGAEVVHFIWNQYLQTNDESLLEESYPLMRSVAKFLLSIGEVGDDGYIHYVGNLHENQWAVKDPSMLLAAVVTAYPVIIEVATELGEDPDLVAELEDALTKIAPLPRTDIATKTQVVQNDSKDADPGYVLAYSGEPNAPLHNVENSQLESVWPFGMIGNEDSDLRDIAVRTFENRSFLLSNDWDYDSIYAARLGLSDEIAPLLKGLVEKFGIYPNGLAYEAGPDFYNEMTGIVALATHESLVQDYDGTLEILPSWPEDWNVSGTVSTINQGKVSVQYADGDLTTVLLEAGADGTQPIESPWAGESVEVKDVTSGQVVVPGTTDDTLTVSVEAGHSYLVQRTASPTEELPFAAVTASPATAAKHLGPVQIGLDAAPQPAEFSTLMNNVGITRDDDTDAGSFDGGDATFSYEALEAKGATPGATITAGGLDFLWPESATGGDEDNVVSNGQRVAVDAQGTTLGFLVSASWGPASGQGTIAYSDGTTQAFTLGSTDWLNGSGTVALAPSYANRGGNTQYNNPAYIRVATVALDPAKTVSYVVLPDISAAAAANTPTLHIFAMSGDWQEAEPELNASATASSRCVAGKAVLTVKVTNDDETAFAAAIASEFGDKSFDSVAPGKSVAAAFSTRQVELAAGEVVVTATADVDGTAVESEVNAPYAARSCGAAQ